MFFLPYGLVDCGRLVFLARIESKCFPRSEVLFECLELRVAGTFLDIRHGLPAL